jgi:prefoldin alpha subunit
MVDEQDLRRKYIELQVLEKQMQEVQKQLTGLDEQVEELRYIIHTFDEIKEVKEGDEAFVPLHNGVFLKVNIKDTSRFAVNVGSGAIVTKNFDETKKMFEDQLTEISNVRGRLEQSYVTISHMAESTQKEVSALIKNYESQ